MFKIKLVLLLIITLLLNTTTFAESPKLVVPANVYDFGTVSEGAQITHEFTIQNHGESNLVIQRIVPSCGCTASSVDADTIQPGAEGKLQVKFDTTGFTGSKLKTVRIYTNDIDASSYVFSLKGSIESGVKVEPKRLVFGDLIAEELKDGVSKEVVVRVSDNSKTIIGKVKSYSKFLTIKEIESSSKFKKVSISINPDIPLGELRERVIVSLLGSNRRSINIPIFATVNSPYSLTPSALSYGVISDNEPIIKRVKFENLSKKPLSIREVQSLDPALKVQFKEIRKGKIYIIIVELDPRKVKKEFRSVVKIILDSEEYDELSFNVYGVLADTN